MPSVWTSWDERLPRAGRPEVLVGELTDAEIVNLLASKAPDRAAEKRMLKDEAFRRMVRAHAEERMAELH